MKLQEIITIPDYKVERDWDTYYPIWMNDEYDIHDIVGPMEVRVYSNQGMVRIVGLINDKIMGYLVLMQQGRHYVVQAVQVNSAYRGKGVATYFYDVAISALNLPVMSDFEQTKGGHNIWKKLIDSNKYDITTVDADTGKEIDYSQAYSGQNVRLIARAR